MPFLPSSFFTCPYSSGLNDAATWTQLCWGDFVRWLETDTPRRCAFKYSCLCLLALLAHAVATVAYISTQADVPGL